MTDRDRSRSYQKYRRQFLSENPFCAWCLKKGLYVAATVLDHIKPLSAGGSMGDPANHQALCDECHDLKSASERGHYVPETLPDGSIRGRRDPRTLRWLPEDAP